MDDRDRLQRADGGLASRRRSVGGGEPVDVPVWFVRVCAVFLAAVMLLQAVRMWVSAGLLGLGGGGSAEYLAAHLLQAGVVPAAVGATAALLLLPNRAWAYWGAVSLVVVAGLLVVFFGPLAWSPPPATGREDAFDALYRRNPWMNAGSDLDRLWGTVTGHLLVAALAWYGLRLTREQHASGDSDTRRRSKVAYSARSACTRRSTRRTSRR